jgi:5-oxoprolinase (ATP-hydrolysing) subunit A
MRQIDINCDMGESFGRWTLGHDLAVMPFITSASIACGSHAGDPSVMERTVRLALEHGVSIGAHPGYPDLAGFGRRVLPMNPDELRLSVLAQLGALWAIARANSAELTHVKAHGALYNRAAVDVVEARAFVEGVRLFSTEIQVYCPPKSRMAELADESSLKIVHEGFIDRQYEPSGLLVDRHLPGSVFTDAQTAATQAVELARGSVTARGDVRVELAVETLCVHGDNEAILSILPAAREALEKASFRIAAPARNSA